MSVYVDEPRDYGSLVKGQARRHGTVWSHMWADTEEELHAMAIKIGLKVEWFQNHGPLPHYDVIPRKRHLALKHGAVEGNTRDAIRKRHPKIAALEDGV